jgi:hypothetical protein
MTGLVAWSRSFWMAECSGFGGNPYPGVTTENVWQRVVAGVRRDDSNPLLGWHHGDRSRMPATWLAVVAFSRRQWLAAVALASRLAMVNGCLCWGWV